MEPRGEGALAHQGIGFAGWASPEVDILAQHQDIEHPARESADIDEIAIAPVPRNADHSDHTGIAVAAHRAEQLGERGERGAVMGIIDDDPHPVRLGKAETPRRILEARAKGCEARGDHTRSNPVGGGHRGGRGGILDIEPGCAVQRHRNIRDRNDRHGFAVPVQHERSALAAYRQSATLEMRLDRCQRVRYRSAGEPDDPSAGAACHPHGERVGSVENAGAALLDVAGNDRFDARQVGERLDALEAEMVGRDIKDCPHVARVEGEPLTQHPAARGLDNRRFDAGVAQQHARALGTARVAPGAAGLADIDARGTGEAGGEAMVFEDSREHAHRRRLAVRSGHREDGDTALLAFRKERGDDRPRNVARRPFRWSKMHAKPGRGIDFDDAAPRRTDALRDIGDDHVDAGDVESERGGGVDCDRRIFGMNDIGPVDRAPAGREVGGAAERHDLACLGHARESEVRLGEKGLERGVDADPGENGLMPDTAAWIVVNRLDQIRDAVPAIAGHMRGDALGDRDHGCADDENAVIGSDELLLDDDTRCDGLRSLEGVAKSSIVGDARGDTAALIAVERFYNDRPAELRGSAFRLRHRPHEFAARYGDTDAREHLFRRLLVRGEFGADQRCRAGHARPNAALAVAGAELDEACLVEPQDGDMPAPRFGHERRGAGAEPVLADDRSKRAHPRVCIGRSAVELRGDTIEPFGTLHRSRKQRVHEFYGCPPGG